VGKLLSCKQVIVDMEEDVELQIGTEKKILIIHKRGQFL
jgi:hypothetical protein